MILNLKDKQQFLVSNFEDKDNCIELSVPTCVTQQILDKFTAENLQEVLFTDNSGNAIAKYANLSLDDDIQYSVQFNQTSFKLTKYHLSARLNDMEEAYKRIPDLMEQLTQAKADIAYISIVSDIDTSEEGETNESGI